MSPPKQTLLTPGWSASRTSRVRWFVGALLVIASIVDLFVVYPPWRLFPPPNIPITPEFGVDDAGNIVYAAKGRGGSDLFVFSRRTGKCRKLAETPLREAQPSFSPDGRWVVCTFDDPTGWSSGLELIETSTGRTRLLFENRYAGCTHPIFSPSGTRILFTHYGAGMESPWCSTARRYLCEFDLSSGKIVELTDHDAYVTIISPCYIDENHVAFSGEVAVDSLGARRPIIGLFTRGGTIKNVDLPDGAPYVQLVGYSDRTKAFCVLAESDAVAGNLIAMAPAVTLNHPQTWRTSSIQASYAALAPGTGEVTFLTEEPSLYVVNRLLPGPPWVQPLLAIPRDEASH